MEKKSKKTIIIGITSLLLVSLILIGLTYAYYRTRIIGNDAETSISVTSKKLEIVYGDGTGTITATGIEPGYTATKTFTVENTGDATAEFSIILDNVVNEFNKGIKERGEYNDWSYVLSDENGEIISGEITTNEIQYILMTESIDSQVTKNYSLVIKYNNLENVDQSEDMGAKLSFRVNISDATSVWDAAEEGTLLYLLKNNNDIAEFSLPVGGAYTKFETISSELETYSVDPTATYKVFKAYSIDTGWFELSDMLSLTAEQICNELNSGTIFYSTDLYLGTTETISYNEIYEISSCEHYSLSSGAQYNYKTLTINKVSEAVLTSIEDNYGTSYFFRGAVENNYVNYSGMCWRIVRVQGDGSIKLALADENNTCDNGYSVSNTMSATINNGNSVKYYANNTFSSFLNSNVYNELNTWVEEKKLDTSKIIESEWCEDLSVASNGNYNSYNRFYAGSPSLKCDFESSTDSKASLIKSSIGLLTFDEILLSGYHGSNGYSEYADEKISYLSKNVTNSYWTMSPVSSDGTNYYFVLIQGFIDIMSATTDGNSSLNSVRPVIVIDADVTATGTGTYTNPYVIS